MSVENKIVYYFLRISAEKFSSDLQHFQKEISNLTDEETPFINPYNEDPEQHIVVVGATLHSKKGSERGEITISQIDLNRAGLVEKRYKKINMLDKAIKACFRTINETLKINALEELKKEADQDREYSLSAKYLLESHEIL